MKSNTRLMFGIALLAIGLVPPEKGPNGFAPPADENTNTSDFSMAIFSVISLLGISIVYAILKNRIIPNKKRNTLSRALVPHMHATEDRPFVWQWI